jgi:hypothetical protein
MEDPELDGNFNVTDGQIKFYQENGFAFSKGCFNG